MSQRGRVRPGRAPGQALVEFALVAPVFFLLLFGIIEAGRFIFYYEILNNATREGARYAIVNGSNSMVCPSGPMPVGSTRPACDPTGDRVRQKVRDSGLSVLNNGLTFPTPTCSGAAHPGVCWLPDNGRDSTVTVAASYTYRTLVPLVPLPPINVSAESSLVINN